MLIRTIRVTYQIDQIYSSHLREWSHAKCFAKEKKKTLSLVNADSYNSCDIPDWLNNILDGSFCKAFSPAQE